MSEPEKQEVDFDAPVPTKKRKAKKRRNAAAPLRAVEPFPGLTKTACADACNAKGCAISGQPYCAHPTKGGLQATDQLNRDAMKRLQNARNQLGVRLDPDRFTDKT